MPGSWIEIPYLKELGVTMVELLPVQQFDPQEGNYWGYMTLNFFAPHRPMRPTPGMPARNSARWSSALHAADIEVILDVVYNHTAEAGDERADVQLPGDRQRRVLRDDRRSASDLPRLYRMREHTGLHQHLHVDVDPRKPPVLGHRDARRRLPVRPGLVLAREPDGIFAAGRHLAPGRDPHRPDPAHTST